MSANYADGLSEFEHKGVLGLPELHDEADDVSQKISHLAALVKNAKHVVLHVGAGLSTAAGIPDFRGPKGVWTLEKKGIKQESISFEAAKPTYSHMAIKALMEANYVSYIVNQNIDGLFLKTGIPRSRISDLHGNFYLDECNVCGTRFIRKTASPTMAQKVSERPCSRPKRSCRGFLRDTILDWEDNLPENELGIAEEHSLKADLSICLGTTMQINPAGKLPFLKRKKIGSASNRQVAIVNLQKTKNDRHADIVIHDYLDNVLTKLCEELNLKVQGYDEQYDLTKYSENCKVW
ncbi:NAD-dependent protein deacetylase Sirt6 [Halotydeus destructor]|nr:NAD-dependent protein deacetylase Sirt6 [Halotydeus destructor]